MLFLFKNYYGKRTLIVSFSGSRMSFKTTRFPKISEADVEYNTIIAQRDRSYIAKGFYKISASKETRKSHIENMIKEILE